MFADALKTAVKLQASVTNLGQPPLIKSNVQILDTDNVHLQEVNRVKMSGKKERHSRL